MSIIAIQRSVPFPAGIVNITATDTIEQVQAANYLTVQIPNIINVNFGLFEYDLTDTVIVSAADGKSFFNLSTDFSTLLPMDQVADLNLNVTALAGGGQTGAPVLKPGFNTVSTVATAADSVQLPSNPVGQTVTVKNTSTNSMNVFPSLGENINALSNNTAIAVAAGATLTFVGITATNWQSH